MKFKFICFALILILFSLSVSFKSGGDKFTFLIEDVYSLSNGRISIVGQVKSGTVKLKDKLLISVKSKSQTLTIEKMEIFAKPNQHDVAYANDFVSFTVSGISKDKVPLKTLITKK